MSINKIGVIIFTVVISILAAIIGVCVYLLNIYSEKGKIEKSQELFIKYINEINENLFLCENLKMDYLTWGNIVFSDEFDKKRINVENNLEKLGAIIVNNKEFIDISSKLNENYIEYKRVTLEDLARKHDYFHIGNDYKDNTLNANNIMRDNVYLDQYSINTKLVDFKNVVRKYFIERNSNLKAIETKLIYYTLIISFVAAAALVMFILYVYYQVHKPFRLLLKHQSDAIAGKSFKIALKNKIDKYPLPFIEAYNKLVDSRINFGENFSNEARHRKGIIDLYSIMSVATSLDSLAESAISVICKYASMNSGAIYLYDNKTDELVCCGLYCPDNTKLNRKTFKPGQGLIGEYFLKDENTYVKNPPKEYYYIQSGLGGVESTELAYLPLRCGSNRVGVVELASLASIRDETKNYLLDCANAISLLIQIMYGKNNNL
jgi:hypothetical protein